MLQRVLLVAIAPPLLMMGVPPFAGLRLRRMTGWLAARPVFVGALYTSVIWLAHAPSVYQAALRDSIAHLALIAALLSVSSIFWSVALGCSEGDSRASDGSAIGILLCFSAMVQTSLLGALLTLSHGVWYPLFIGRTAAWGLAPLEDQQLAGAIMWVPMGGIYLGAALLLIRRWLAEARHGPLTETGDRP